VVDRTGVGAGPRCCRCAGGPATAAPRRPGRCAWPCPWMPAGFGIERCMWSVSRSEPAAAPGGVSDAE